MSDPGMTILFEGEEPIEADVVFVHGLGGGSHETWARDGRVWPRDFLKDRVQHARIMTWGYESDPTRFFKRQGYQSFVSHSQDLLADLQLERDEDAERHRPIIFVGHDVGGLIIKQALCKAVELTGRRAHQRQAEIITYCAGIIFMGTPHHSVNPPAWTATATRLARAIGQDGNDEIVASIESGLPALEGLQDTFAAIQPRFNIHTFLEGQALDGIGKVVEDQHAILDCENERCATISADHRNMCKFAHNKDPGYRRVAGAIKEQVEDASECLEQQKIVGLQPTSPVHADVQPATADNHPTVDVRHPPNEHCPPPPYKEQSSPKPRSSVSDSFSVGSMRESLLSLSPQSTSRSRPLSAGAPSTPPPLTRNEKVLGLANYRRLYQETLQIEGPCPPERYQKIIEVLKEEKRWINSLEAFRSYFDPEDFDPSQQEFRNKLLWLACYTGDAETVRQALAAGADPQYRLVHLQDCPLNAAMTFDHTEILKMLFQAGASMFELAFEADSNEQEVMLLHLKTLSAASVRMCIENRGKTVFPSTAVLAAAESPSPGMLQVFHDYGYDITVCNSQGGTVLHLAAQYNRAETVAWLISLGFPVESVDNVGQTPLYDALLSFEPTMVDLLLTSHGASPKVRDKKGDTPVHVIVRLPVDKEGEPVMSDEIAELKIGMIKSLVRAGAALDVSNNAGYQPLHIACIYGHGVVVYGLLLLGADPNACDDDGWTPLHLCAKGTGEQVVIAQLLIKAGASLKAKLPAPNNSTPLQLAKRFASAQMVALLKNAKTDRGVEKWLARRGVT